MPFHGIHNVMFCNALILLYKNTKNTIEWGIVIWCWMMVENINLAEPVASNRVSGIFLGASKGGFILSDILHRIDLMKQIF